MSDPVTPTPILVHGDPVVTGLPASPALSITGVTNITSEVIDIGYQASENIPDDKGNIVSVVLSQYGATVQFQGDLDASAASRPKKGDAVSLTIDGITYPTAHISDLSIAYTPTGKAAVSGTVTGYAKLTAAAQSAQPAQE